MIQNPKHPQTNRLLAGWFRLRPEIIRLQLCDRLKDSHRFVSVFWILANDGANLSHPPPPDEPPHLLRLARKSPLALHCLPSGALPLPTVKRGTTGRLRASLAFALCDVVAPRYTY